MIGLSVLEQVRLEDLIGEPLIAPDPLIDIRQASAVLGLTATEVRGLLDSGALPRRDGSVGQLSTRSVRLADVLAWGKTPSRITVADAAGLLQVSPTAVHRLASVQLLGWYGGLSPLARSEVESLAVRRSEWLTLGEASIALRVPHEEVHRLLNSGTLEHTSDVSRPVDGAQVPARGAPR